MEEEKAGTISATPADDEGKTSEPSHDSNKPERTEKEKAAFSLKKTAERLRELGGSPDEVLGIKPKLNVDESLDDDTPLTVGTLREIQKQDAKKTALQLAGEIEDEDERTKVVAIIERLAPSGDPQADLTLARTAVNAARTEQIAAEAARKGKPTRTAAGGSAPARQEEEFTPTAQEAVFMAPPYNLKKEKILEARRQVQEKSK